MRLKKRFLDERLCDENLYSSNVFEIASVKTKNAESIPFIHCLTTHTSTYVGNKLLIFIH